MINGKFATPKDKENFGKTDGLPEEPLSVRKLRAYAGGKGYVCGDVSVADVLLHIDALRAKAQELEVQVRNQEAQITGRHQYVGQDYEFRLKRLKERAEAAEARERAAREALQQFAECNLNDSNCASLEVATARIRSIARAALRAGEKA